MIRINLLPYRAARSKENIRKQVSVVGLSFVLLFVLLGGYNIHLSAKINNFVSKIETLKEEVAIYEVKSQKVETIKKKLKRLERQIEIIKQLESRRDDPPKLMEKMTDMVVQGRMQLTRFISAPKNITVSGIAMDNETIAIFMTRLERSSLFRSVSLTSSKKVKRFKISMKKFQIKCNKIVKKTKASATKEKKDTGKRKRRKK